MLLLVTLVLLGVLVSVFTTVSVGLGVLVGVLGLGSVPVLEPVFSFTSFALASSAFVTGAVGLCAFTKNKLNNGNTEILPELKKEIEENASKESELTTSLYNGFYSEDKRKVL